jgi:hypothetical protein
MPDTARMGPRIGRNPGSRGLSSVTFVSHPLPFSRVAQEVVRLLLPLPRSVPRSPKGGIPHYFPDEQAFSLREMRRLNHESSRHLREDLRDMCNVCSQVRLHK